MTTHVDSVKTYTLVFIGLIILTGVTSWVAFADLGPFSTVIALGIAGSKALLVALFFMHLRHSTQMLRLVVMGGLLWLAILIMLTFADLTTRGILGIPGR